MNTIFYKAINSFILVYLDDILSYNRSMGEQWDHLRCALDKLCGVKLFDSLPKCEFLKDKVDYLGIEVSWEGIRTSSEKVRPFSIGPGLSPRMMFAHFWGWHPIIQHLFADSHKSQSP